MSIECPDPREISAIELDRDGGHYVFWVERLTRDDLHSKADIAQCLGWQRREIERLRAFVAAFDAYGVAWREWSESPWHDPSVSDSVRTTHRAMLAAREAVGPCS